MTLFIYALGVTANWQNYTNALQQYKNAQKVVLPNYAFDLVSCWFNDKPFEKGKKIY
jgi:hypothetical protein